MDFLPKVQKFIRGTYPYKYTAILKDGKKVHFGHQDYEHYKDTVPKKLGGGLWSNRDHLDTKRRTNYRKRHAAIKTKDGKYAYRVKYTPSWFSYHYLW